MKIETESFKFSPTFSVSTAAQSLKISTLQQQYLSYLAGQDSIEQLVVRLLNNGWLVNFQELFHLVEKLVQNNLILNPNIVNYFKQHLVKSSATTSLALSESKPKHEILDQLIELPFFRSLPKDLALILFQKSTLKKYSASSTICRTGDNDRTLYVILTGQAAVYKPTPQGHQFISVIGAPGLFGEASFLTGSAKSADIVTTQTCDVLCVPYPAEILDPILNQSMGHQMAKRFWIQNALSQSDFFKKIPADCLDALTFSGKVIQLQNEQILFKQNDPSLAAYLVVQGQIKIAQDGKIISTLGQGGFFGEISLTMTNGMRSASAFSVGATTLLEINRNDFYLLLSRNLFLAKEIQSLAFHRLNQDQMRS